MLDVMEEFVAYFLQFGQFWLLHGWPHHLKA